MLDTNIINEIITISKNFNETNAKATAEELNKLIDNSRLNVLGRQGWELCGFSQDQNDYIYYFKKPNE